MQNFDCKFLFQHTVLIKSELIVGVLLENCSEKLTNLTNFSKKGLYRRHYFTVNFTKIFRENSLWNTSKWLLFENFVYRFMLNKGHVMIYCIFFATLFFFLLFFFFFSRNFEHATCIDIGNFLSSLQIVNIITLLKSVEDCYEIMLTY